jgi:hypothetical protein
MRSGERRSAWIELENQSSLTWGLDETRLGTAEPHGRASAFFVPGDWLAPDAAAGADQAGQGPGAVGRFRFDLVAPEVTEPTRFVESFQLQQEGAGWFGPVVTLTIDVVPAGGGADGKADDPGDAAGGCASTRGSSVPAGLALALALALGRGITARRQRPWARARARRPARAGR